MGKRIDVSPRIIPLTNDCRPGLAGYTNPMLPDRISIALKEWAVVQRSLLEQHQIILIRKGGIAEESGDFDLRAKQFLILPGYEHETERLGDIQPCFEQWLREEEQQKPRSTEIRFECACDVEEIIRLDDRDKLIELSSQHIWSRQFIDGRFDWEPYKPVSVLVVRAYRLPEPVFAPYLREYGGCRSWIKLESPISTRGAVTVISTHGSFERRHAITTKYLNQSSATV
jgi:hypothetical protein